MGFFQKSQSEEMKARWADPEYKARVSKAISEAQIKRFQKRIREPDLRKNHNAPDGRGLQISDHKRGYIKSERSELLRKRCQELGVTQKVLLNLLVDEFLKNKKDVRIGFIQ